MDSCFALIGAHQHGIAIEPLYGKAVFRGPLLSRRAQDLWRRVRCAVVGVCVPLALSFSYFIAQSCYFCEINLPSVTSNKVAIVKPRQLVTNNCFSFDSDVKLLKCTWNFFSHVLSNTDGYTYIRSKSEAKAFTVDKQNYNDKQKSNTEGMKIINSCINNFSAKKSS